MGQSSHLVGWKSQAFFFKRSRGQWALSFNLIQFYSELRISACCRNQQVSIECCVCLQSQLNLGESEQGRREGRHQTSALPGFPPAQYHTATAAGCTELHVEWSRFSTRGAGRRSTSTEQQQQTALINSETSSIRLFTRWQQDVLRHRDRYLWAKWGSRHIRHVSGDFSLLTRWTTMALPPFWIAAISPINVQVTLLSMMLHHRAGNQLSYLVVEQSCALVFRRSRGYLWIQWLLRWGRTGWLIVDSWQL